MTRDKIRKQKGCNNCKKAEVKKLNKIFEKK